MARIYVKLESKEGRECFVIETDRTATVIDHGCIRPFVREGVQVTCLREEGAEKYGWKDDAER